MSSRTDIKSKRGKKKRNGEIVEIECPNQGGKLNGDALRADWTFSCSQIHVPLVFEYVLD